MTLSFTAHWHDELPGFYTALNPTPLKNARLIWHNASLANDLGVPASLFHARWHRSIAATSLVCGQDSLGTDVASCWANNSSRMDKPSTGI